MPGTSRTTNPCLLGVVGVGPAPSVMGRSQTSTTEPNPAAGAAGQECAVGLDRAGRGWGGMRRRGGP